MYFNIAYTTLQRNIQKWVTMVHKIVMNVVALFSYNDMNCIRMYRYAFSRFLKLIGYAVLSVFW